MYKWSLESDRVIYCGFTNEVEKYLAASDAYVLPSYREGFGSAVIEAEAMGVPVIVSDIPGPTDAMQLNKTGLISVKGDANSLYEAMKRMYFYEDMRNCMGKASEIFASKKFDQRVLFKKIIENRIMLLNNRMF